MICFVCHQDIDEGESWFYHARLNVSYHDYHTTPLNDDTVTWGGRRDWI